MDKLPTPVKTESRIAFGIQWYATEAEAIQRAAAVPESLQWGKALGRAPEFDIRGGPGNALLFAVKVP